MATTRRRRMVMIVRQLGHGFGPQTGRTNGIGDRHERFLASQRGPGLRFAGASSLLLLRVQSLLRKQELCLIALHGRVSGLVSSEERKGLGRTATAAFVTLLLGDRSRVRAAPNTLRSAGSTPSASSCWRRKTYLVVFTNNDKKPRKGGGGGVA